MPHRLGRKAIPSAFTLVELLVVIAIIGVLVAMLLPAIQSARESARMAACKNILKQLGLALHQHHDVQQSLPAGWIANAGEPEGDPGWGWGAMILPFLEEAPLFQEHVHLSDPIGAPQNQLARETILSAFLCPSEANGEQFMLPQDDGHDHNHDDEDAGAHEEDEAADAHDPEHDGHFDEGEPLLLVARSNYVGMFGTNEIEDEPSSGNGVLFHNSRLPFRRIIDGLSKTIFVGERSSRLGGSVWVGNVHGAKESMARVVGCADHTPNSHAGHFDDFSSRHPQGVLFLFGDGSVRRIDDTIDPEVYSALSTRAGAETAQWAE